MIQWPDKKLNAFKEELKRAREKRKQVAKEYDWEGNRARYVPKPTIGSDGRVTHDVNVGADFRDVERKKAALFNAMPPVVMTPDVPTQPVMVPGPDGQMAPHPQGLTLGALVPMHQELVNGLLGPRHANAERPLVQGVFDVLCTAGVAVFKTGYETRTVEVDAPIPGSVNPITQQPMTQKLPVPIWEHWFVSRCSPMGLLLPAEFRNTDHALSHFIGYDKALPASHARTKYGLGEDWKPKGAVEGGKPYFADEGEKASPHDPEVIVTYVEYKTEYYAEPGQDVHPEQLSVMVLVDDQVVKHDPHPDQTIDEQTGRLTLDSVDTFTIQTMVIRDLSDSAWVPSDSTVTAALTKEINKYRTVTVNQRDAQKDIIVYDPAKLTGDAKAKIEAGTIGRWVPLEPDALAGGIDTIMKQVTTISQGRESYIGQDYIERDREKILGIGDNQSGANTQTKRTATESSIVQRNSEARFEQEHDRCLEAYLAIVRVFDRYVLRYCDARNAALILGNERAQVWAEHKQALLGGYHYELQIDAGKFKDVEADRRQIMQIYSALRPDPSVNPTPLLEMICGKFGFDPNALIVREQPEKKPDPPKINFSIAATDLNPALAQFPLIVEVLRHGGVPLSAEAIQLAQAQAQQLAAAARNSQGDSINEPMEAQVAMSAPMPTAGASADPKAPKDTGHPGMQPPQPNLGKHLADETGQLPGQGAGLM